MKFVFLLSRPSLRAVVHISCWKYDTVEFQNDSSMIRVCLVHRGSHLDKRGAECREHKLKLLVLHVRPFIDTSPLPILFP